MPNVIFKIGSPTDGRKRSSVNVPSRARMEYIDQDKAIIVNKSIELKSDPNNKEIIRKIHEAEKRLKGHDQEHKFFVEGNLGKELNKQGFQEASREGRLNLFYKEWVDKLSKQKRKSRQVGVRSFILSPETKALSGISIESQKELIKETILQSMDDYQKKYLEKGDSISYAFGFHENTEHVHSHIYLYPYSERGQYLSLNAGKYNKKRQDIAKNRKLEDKFMYLSKKVEQVYEKELEKTLELNKEQNKQIKLRR